MLQREGRISLNQSNWSLREMFKVTSIPLSSEKDASIAISPETAKFIPSWMLISLPFFIPRYGCTNGSPRDSTAHKQKKIWDEKKKINIYVGAN